VDQAPKLDRVQDIWIPLLGLRELSKSAQTFQTSGPKSDMRKVWTVKKPLPQRQLDARNSTKSNWRLSRPGRVCSTGAHPVRLTRVSGLEYQRTLSVFLISANIRKWIEVDLHGSVLRQISRLAAYPIWRNCDPKFDHLPTKRSSIIPVVEYEHGRRMDCINTW
jgi:hypothetical protein